MKTELITNNCNSVYVYTSTHTCYMGQHSCGYPTAHPLNGNTPTIPNPSVVVGVDGSSTPRFLCLGTIGTQEFMTTKDIFLQGNWTVSCSVENGLQP